jgi:hypothetical protein
MDYYGKLVLSSEYRRKRRIEGVSEQNEAITAIGPMLVRDTLYV